MSTRRDVRKDAKGNRLPKGAPCGASRTPDSRADSIVSDKVWNRTTPRPSSVDLNELIATLRFSGPVDCCRSRVGCRPEAKNARRAGVNVIIELVHAYATQDETAAHAIVLFDRYLSAEISQNRSPDLLCSDIESCAVACFLITTKFREVSSPCLSDLSRLMFGRCTTEQIVASEVEVLTALQWDLCASTGD